MPRVTLPDPERLAVTQIRRAVASALLAAAFLSLLFALGVTYWFGPDFAKLLAGLDGPFPTLTQLFLATYAWWWLLIAPFALLVINILRQSRPSLLYAALVSAATVLCACALCVWLFTAVRLPMDAILEAID